MKLVILYIIRIGFWTAPNSISKKDIYLSDPVSLSYYFFQVPFEVNKFPPMAFTTCIAFPSVSSEIHFPSWKSKIKLIKSDIFHCNRTISKIMSSLESMS